MKEYKYRAHLKVIKIILLVMFIIFTLGLLASIAFMGFDYYGTIILFVIVLEMGFLQLFYKRFTSTTLYIKSYGVGLKNNKKDIYTPFEEIKQINTAKVSNLGGFFTIVSPNNEKIRVTVTLKNVADFVKTLKERLLEYDRPDLANDPKLFAFYKTAAYSDDSFRRIRYLFPVFIVSFILMIISNFYLTLNEIVDMNAAFAISVFLSMAYMIYIELAYYGKKVRKQTPSDTWEIPTFDEALEKKHYLMITIIAVGAYVVLGILLNI